MGESALPESESEDAESRSGRLAAAALHDAVPRRLWAGSGCGAACDLCRARIGADQVEYEVDAELDGRSIVLHFHRECHELWKASRGEAPLRDDPEAPS